MNIIQTYYNSNITLNDINFKADYLSPESNWLSVAYSCLLLKKNNPQQPLILYGNETVIRLFIDLFKLPYDKYHVCDPIIADRDYLYCWPKINTYKHQKEPFIHVDNDIFMWESIPQRLLNAKLLAQHRECDSTFYMLVYKYLQENKMQLPAQISKYCVGDGYINSYNAGLLGGNDMDFFQKYVYYINEFLDVNKEMIKKSDKNFLLNVVFEQWLFYAFAKSRNIAVETYYDSIVKDFELSGGNVPLKVLGGKSQKYIHIMEYKKDIRCNRFIVRNMANDFPDYYDRILSVCRNNGLEVSLRSMWNNILPKQEFNKRSKNYAIEGLYDRTILEKLVCFEDYVKSLYIEFSKDANRIFDFQMYQKNVLDLISSDPQRIQEYELSLSPYARIVEVDNDVKQIIVHTSKQEVKKDSKIILVYNALFNHIDEFIYVGFSLKFTSNFKTPIKMVDLFRDIESRTSTTKILNLIKKGLFDNILYCNRI